MANCDRRRTSEASGRFARRNAALAGALAPAVTAARAIPQPVGGVGMTTTPFFLTRTTVAPLVGDAQVQAAPRTSGLTVSYKY